MRGGRPKAQLIRTDGWTRLRDRRKADTHSSDFHRSRGEIESMQTVERKLLEAKLEQERLAIAARATSIAHRADHAFTIAAAASQSALTQL